MKILFGVILSILINRSIGCMDTYYQQPSCLDRPHGYDCDCGAGFAWNSQSCVAAGIDSRLHFESRSPVAYAELKTKTGLPDLHNFTISVWLRPVFSGTVVSYAGPNGETWIRVFYIGRGQCSFVVRLRTAEMKVGLPGPITGWTHFMWVQQLTSRGTVWNVYVNGTAFNQSGGQQVSHDLLILPERGYLVLGQSPRSSEGVFDTAKAFRGDMAHFNLWKRPLGAKMAKAIFEDCTFMHCGDVVEWAHFRRGTRGNMRLKWPSGVFHGYCVSAKKLRSTCDKDCSKRIGAQCKSEVRENILWPRTKANNMSQVQCPGSEYIDPTIQLSKNETFVILNATRFCNVTEDREGKWEKPNVTNCISEFLETEIMLTEDLERKAASCQLGMVDLTEIEDFIINVTIENQFFNPVDLSAVSRSLKTIAGWRRKMRQGFQCWPQETGISKSLKFIAKMDDIVNSFNSTASILDRLLSSRNAAAWNLTRPPGQEAVRLIDRVEDFLDEAIVELLDAMERETTLTPEQAGQLIVKENILLKVQMEHKNTFHGAALPDELDIKSASVVRRYEEKAVAAVQPRLFTWNNGSSADVNPNYTYITTILAIYPYLQHVIPNTIKKEFLRRNTGMVQRREDTLNSAVVQIRIFLDEHPLQNVEIPLKVKFFYTNGFNISNVACVRLDNTKLHHDWTTDGCTATKVAEEYVICSCTHGGFLAVLSDMYDLNWKRDVKKNPLVETPSYIGCSISALLCFTAFVMLNYYRTASNTASIHKHFSLAVVGGQLAFMIGIDKYQHPLMCQAFAVLLHYFFLASLSWLMNEAFNLYIVITYAAHSHGDHTEGSMWRYYLLGWIVPAILVLAFVLANKSDYYADNMCWIQWKHVWLFVGPAITIIAITILVLTFTAKEHHESSYTKNEKANRSIVIQTKALWTQVILLSIAWCFAFITVKMRGAMLKYLYMVFNCLQGLFFIVFYFLLNEEVQAIHSDNQKRHNLELDGIGTDEEDDDVFVTEIANPDESHPGSSPRHHSMDEGRRSRSRTPKRASSRKLRHRKGDSDLTDDENSDCEMIVTSV